MLQRMVGNKSGVGVRHLAWLITFSGLLLVGQGQLKAEEMAPPPPGKLFGEESRTAAQAVKFEKAPVSGGFFKAYLQAKEMEATFQTAKAERDFNQVGASASRAAYLPEMRYTKQRLEIDTGTRTTLSVTQPIIALDRFASFMEGSHREKLSEYTFQQREQELAGRIYKIIADIIRYTEGLRANKAKIDALEQQHLSAQKMLKLGEGTITDVSDTQVRLGQAKADGMTILGKYQAAVRQFEMTTGRTPGNNEFAITKGYKKFPIPPQEIDQPVSEQSAVANAQVNIALENYEMTKLATLKQQGAFLPSVLGAYTATEINGVKNNYTGITISLPLQAPSLFNVYGAKANETKAREVVKEAENKAKLEIDRLKALLEAGIVEVKYRKENIDATELNVKATEKSMRGGERSKTDVLNAIQAKFQADEEYVNAVLMLAENYLNYAITLNVTPETALQLTNKLVF